MHSWHLCFLVSNFVLSSFTSLVLDTFEDVKMSGCTCSFTMTLNDDGIVDGDVARLDDGNDCENDFSFEIDIMTCFL